MEAQDIFNTVVDHLRQQNSKALMSEELRKELCMSVGACAYRSVDGKKCAAGCLILDEEYDRSMEGRAAYALLTIENYGCSASLRERLSAHASLIGELQAVHDFHLVEEWEEELQRTANKFKLVYSAAR